MVQHALQQLLQHSVALTALSPSGCRNVGAWHDIVGALLCAFGRLADAYLSKLRQACVQVQHSACTCRMACLCHRFVGSIR